MKQIFVQIPFESNKKQIAGTKRKLLSDILKAVLNRKPDKAECARFVTSANPENSSITDMCYDGKKIGSLSTTYILDGHRGIIFQFLPVEK